MMFFISSLTFKCGMENLVEYTVKGDIKQTLRKVNLTAFVCTIVFGIRFISWIYGSLIYDLNVISAESPLVWDLDQVFFLSHSTLYFARYYT